MKDWAKKFYSSKAWIDCRKSFLIDKHFICNRCGSSANIVHHKQHITKETISDPNITLAWDNLEALCQDCHNTEHHSKGEGVTRDGLMFDEFGGVTTDTPPMK